IDAYTHVYKGKHDLHRGIEEFHSDQYSTDLYAASAIDFIRRKAGGPFFVYLPFDAPHFPSAENVAPGQPVKWQAPPEFFGRYGLSPDEPDAKKRYRVVITALDDAIGRVLRTLDELGLRENTLVILYSDNGAFMLPGRGLEVASNAPLRSGGVTLWEGGIRVPAVFRWPGQLPAGTVCGEPIISTDILPTLLAVAGIQPPVDRVLDGRNVKAVLAGTAAAAPRDFFWEFQQGKNKMSAVRRGQYKLHRGNPNAPWALFDVVNDLGETKDLATAKPHLLQALANSYQQWSEAVVD
ncbi:MAG: sulfatase-like hydrolase/transferase, partial [Opitutaceae bacterium]